MLPEMSGIVVLHEIRKISNIPVIMLTALDDEYTQSNSFDEMADDYITKPFSMLILGKRITALLRRSQNKPAVNTVKLGDITVDFLDIQQVMKWQDRHYSKGAGNLESLNRQ